MDRQPHGRPTRTAATRLLVGAAVIALGAWSAAPATAAAPPVPQLRIAVDDGETSAAPGDALRYEVVVENLGADDLSGLHVSQTVPAGLTHAESVKGRTSAEGIAWTIDLAAGDSATFVVTADVVDTPDALLRLASVACAAATVDAPPLVCAADSNLLPAGKAAKAEEAGDASASPDGTPDRADRAPADDRVAILAGAAVLVLAAVGGVIVLTRRRRRQAGPGPSPLLPSTRVT